MPDRPAAHPNCRMVPYPVPARDPMLRMIDLSAVRIGSEIYAEENESFGLTTLKRRHVKVDGSQVRLNFPAKSGKRADLLISDRAVARGAARSRIVFGFHRRFSRRDGCGFCRNDDART